MVSILHFISLYTIPPATNLQEYILGLLRQEVTIITIAYSRWLECRKKLSLAVTWTPGNMQSRHAPWSHTLTGMEFLPYLNISDFSWFNILFPCSLAIPLSSHINEGSHKIQNLVDGLRNLYKSCQESQESQEIQIARLSVNFSILPFLHCSFRI